MQYWQIWKDHAVSTHSSSYNIDKTNFESDSNFHRDKSASCNLGLDLGPRPTTVIGIPPNRNRTSFRNELKEKSPKKKVNFQEKKNDPVEKKAVCSSNLSEEKSVSVVSLASLTNENIAFIDEGRELTDRTSMVTESDDAKRDCDHLQITHEKVKDAVLAEVKIHDIIKKFDEHKQETVVKPKIYPRSQIKKPPDVPQKPDSSKKPVVPPRSVTTKIRGRLDKSHSTPAYDLTGDENVPVEKFVVEKTQAEIIVENHNSVSESKVDVEPFTETKFELGIPVVEAINFPLTQNVPAVEEIKCTVTQVVEKTVEIKEEIIDEDLPPKPPPRTFGVVDLNKPAYPIDSPKPNISEKLKTDQSLPPKTTVFEFPETKPISLYSVESTIMVSTTTKPPESPALLKDNGKMQSKHFEPKVASTPKTKTELENEGMGYKSTPSFDSQKNMSDNKISPTNSIVRAMIYSNKNKAGKKKNTITAKRRRVTVNDLNPPDTQGFLYQRLRSKHNQNIHWEKRWFVLLGSCLYGFKTKEDPRAACLIFLSGFTVAVASEVKSRSNAFKVYHTGTVFYFSAEDPEALQSWIEMITAATLNNECLKITDGSLYSETDESDNDKPKKVEPEKNPESIKKFGSLKKLTSKKHEGTSSGSTSLDRKRFFNKSSSHSKNSLPVPTAQFRSYRKIKTNEGHTTGNSTWHVASFLQTTEIPKLQQSGQNVSVPNLTVEHLGKGQDGAKAPTGKLSKVKPINYVHASNPSLCNINDFNVPSFTKKSFKQCNENLAGFVTLEELMIRQSEERKMNPYNTDEDVFINLNLIKPDVVYGEVPIRPKEKVEVEEKGEPTFKRGHSRNASDSQKSSEKQDFSSSCFGKRLGSLKKSHKEDDAFENRTSTYPKIAKGFDQKLNRSLPRTHKVSDNPDGSNRYASDRNLAGAERGYEMIYCPETTTDIQFAQNRNLDDRMYKDTPKKSHKIKKQHSFTSADKKSVKSIVETVKYTNKVSDSSTGKLKSVDQYTRMCLPLAQDQKNKPKLAFELNLDEKGTKGGKLKQIFGKQGEGKKEKTFLGSPKLHRTIFRKSNTGSEINWPSSSSQSVPISQSTYSLENTPPAEPLSMSISPHADYPGLEYPPVFEPETYSLADPQSSLTLLRKQGKSSN
jgi:hypothetical protein